MMKKALVLMFLTAFLLQISLSIASTITQFDDGTSAFNMTGNITKYVSLPIESTILEAMLSIRGLNTTNYISDETANSTNSATTDLYLYINYSRPAAVSGVVWQVKHGTESAYNVSVPGGCFNQTIQFRFYSNASFPTYFNSTSWGECYNYSNSQYIKITELIDDNNACGVGAGSGAGNCLDGNYNTACVYNPPTSNWRPAATNFCGANLYEEAVFWSYIQFPFNFSIIVNSTMVFNHSLNLTTINVSINLSPALITNYLLYNTTLPISFRALNFGKVEIFNFSISYNPRVNFSLYNEQTNTLITDLSYLEFYGDNFSSNLTANQTGNITLTQDTFEIRYFSPLYTKRNYYITIYNYSTSIRLYLLNASDSTHVYKELTVVDESANPVQNALVRMQRQYLDCNGCWRDVEMVKTGETGRAFLFTELYDAVYRFIIEINGTIKKVTNDTKLDTRTLSFKISLLGDSLSGFYDAQNIVGTLAFNKNNDIWTYTYVSSLAEEIQSGQLVVLRETIYGTTTVCDSSVTGASASITCNQSSLANETGVFTAYAYTTSTTGDQNVIDIQTQSYTADHLTYGLDGILIAVMIILVMTFIGAWKPDVMIILYLLGFVVVIYSGFIVIQVSWFIGFIITGLLFVKEMRT